MPSGFTVGLQFIDDFQVYCGYRDSCFHWVEVQYEADKNTQGPRFCCGSALQQEIVSEWNEMTVLFRSDYPVNSARSRRGFRAVVRAIRDPNVAGPVTTTTTIQSTTQSATQSTTQSTVRSTAPSTTQQSTMQSTLSTTQSTESTTKAPTTMTMEMMNMGEGKTICHICVT